MSKTIAASLSVFLFVSVPLYAGDSGTAGMKCLKPVFTVGFIGKDIVELTTTADVDSSFRVWITELPAINSQVHSIPESRQQGDVDADVPIVIPALDTARLRDGEATNIFRLSGFHLLQSSGRVVVHYQAINPGAGCPQWDSGEVIVPAVETDHLDINAGILFGLGTSGALKGEPEIAVSISDKLTSALSSFVELRYSSIAALDSITTTLTSKQFFDPFEQGGGVMDADFGFMIHPWYGESQQEIYMIMAGGGFRSFAEEGIREVFDRPRGFIGLHANILTYNQQEDEGGLNGATGYIELGYSYDEFWRVDAVDSTGHTIHPFYEPQRLFFESQIELNAGSPKIPIAARIMVDVPMKDFLGGRMELNFGIVAGISPSKLADLLAGVTHIFR